MIVRAGVVVFGFWGLWACARQATYPLTCVLRGDWAQAAPALIDLLTVTGPVLLLAAALVLCEGKLVRWIVPFPPREATCAQCGYSLKNLKSPICPECGADFK